MNHTQYTYRVTWSSLDGEYVGLCEEFPSLSWLDSDQEKAFKGIVAVVEQVVEDMRANGETIPTPLALVE